MDFHKFHKVGFFSARVGKKYAKACAAQTQNMINVGDRELFCCHWGHSSAILQAHAKITPKLKHSVFIMRMSVPISQTIWSDRSTWGKSGPHTRLALIEDYGCIAYIFED